MTVTGKNGKPVNATPGVQGFQETTRPEGVKPANLIGADSPIANAIAAIEENRGRFENGYDDIDISDFAAEVDGVQFAALWDEYDIDDGYRGDSKFIVRETPDGPWHELHDTATGYLLGLDDAPADLTGLDTLSSDRVVFQYTSAAMMDDRGNFAEQADDVCRTSGCFELTDDGQGWDGYCGNCADIVSEHEEGDHIIPREDCPECNA
ncbi:hypothetical protein [Aeromicrobium sp. 179-A 4D2 NHS]|uniref:hypothetical protein n=1 Tax=Aeromicrobium sp. 179-A 4D2 NHS TaxID=3142375 RepID=UPI0039A0CE38